MTIKKAFCKFTEKKGGYGVDFARIRRNNTGKNAEHVATLAGMTRQTYSAFENDKKHLSFEEACNIAYVLGLNLESMKRLLLDSHNNNE